MENNEEWEKQQYSIYEYESKKRLEYYFILKNNDFKDFKNIIDFIIKILKKDEIHILVNKYRTKNVNYVFNFGKTINYLENDNRKHINIESRNIIPSTPTFKKFYNIFDELERIKKLFENSNEIKFYDKINFNISILFKGSEKFIYDIGNITKRRIKNGECHICCEEKNNIILCTSRKHNIGCIDCIKQFTRRSCPLCHKDFNFEFINIYEKVINEFILYNDELIKTDDLEKYF